MSKAVDSGQPSHANDLGKPPDWYLDCAIECMRRAQQMASESISTKVKLNLSQCKYLAEELQTAVEDSRRSYARSSSYEHKTECLEALKLLFRLAKEVESFIQDCCKQEAWIQSAFTSASVAVRVCSWGYYLKLCTEVLRSSNKLGGAWLTFINLESPGHGERYGLVKNMASNDEDTLLKALESLTLLSASDSTEVLHMASILLERLKAMSTAGSSQASNWRLRKVDTKLLLKLQALGRGTVATVHRGTWYGKVEVAVKVFPTPSHPDLMEEVSLLAHLSHPNIVSFLGYGDDGQSCSMVMELMDGDLRLLVQQIMQGDSARLTPFSISVACDIMLQVAEGVDYMHQRGFAHGNLKSTSILVKSSKDAYDEYISAKVANFGLFKTKGRCVDRNATWREYATPRWMAQEVLPSGQYGHDYLEFTKHVLESATYKSDAYSFAMLCIEILTGNMAFSNIEVLDEVRKAVLEGHRPKLPSNCPPDLKNLIELCWDPVPNTRPAFERICAELRYIKCSLLLGALGQENKQSSVTPTPKALDLPGKISRFKGDYFSLKMVRQLGKGGSDSVIVYLATWRRPEGALEETAQKLFFGSHDECFVNEVSIMAELEHPTVVRLLFYATDRRSCSIVMELMDEDLHDLIRRRRLKGNETPTGPFFLYEAVHIILQIAQGMEYVHGKNVVHRDLKSCNILVRKAMEGEQLEVKVADFGLSKKLASKSTCLGKEDSGVGTVRWMAPEVMGFENSGLSNYDPFKSDVYSFGMVCYEILAGRVPFCEMQSLTQVKEEVLVRNGRPSLPKCKPLILKTLIAKCWQALKALMKKCWHRESNRRPSFSEIIKELVAIIEDFIGELVKFIEESPIIIEELTKSIKALPKLIDELTKTIKTLPTVIEKLTKTIEIVSKNVKDLASTIKTSAQINISHEDFTQNISKEEELIKMQGELVEKQEDLSEAQDDLIEKEDELSKKQKELISKQEELTKKQEELTKKQEELVESRKLINKWRQIPI